MREWKKNRKFASERPQFTLHKKMNVVSACSPAKIQLTDIFVIPYVYAKNHIFLCAWCTPQFSFCIRKASVKVRNLWIFRLSCISLYSFSSNAYMLIKQPLWVFPFSLYPQSVWWEILFSLFLFDSFFLKKRITLIIILKMYKKCIHSI